MSRRLRELQRQFDEVQRLAQVGLWEWDIPADRVIWTDELYRIYGLEPGAFAATYEAFLERIHPDDREMVHRTVMEAYESRRPYAFDHRLVRPDGQVRWLHGRGNVDVDERGEPVRLYGVAIDITDRKRTEQFLRDFTANAAHELRTPASAIAQAVDLLDRLPADDPRRSEVTDALRRQADRLRRLTTDLLDLTALESGTAQLMLGPVELAPVVTAAVEAVTVPSPVEVDVEVPDGLWVRAAPDELERVFVNLLSNAARYAGSRITVRAGRAGDEVVAEVADDGPGVSPELVADLFTPFAKGDARRPGGGLGLAICRRLMTAFGGHIDYAPRVAGARFVLRFPAEEPPRD